MSWDKSIRSIKCPCGKGTIEEEIREDDWNRIEISAPYLCCDECKKKYRIICLPSRNIFSWKGCSDSYYLVPIDYKFNKKAKSLGEYNDRWQIAKIDFIHYLVLTFSMDELTSALDEMKLCSSCNSLKGHAHRIAKEKKKLLGTAKLKDLLSEVNMAINKYDSYEMNYDKVKKIEEYNYQIDCSYREEIEKIGILINI